MIEQSLAELQERQEKADKFVLALNEELKEIYGHPFTLIHIDSKNHLWGDLKKEELKSENISLTQFFESHTPTGETTYFELMATLKLNVWAVNELRVYFDESSGIVGFVFPSLEVKEEDFVISPVSEKDKEAFESLSKWSQRQFMEKMRSFSSREMAKREKSELVLAKEEMKEKVYQLEDKLRPAAEHLGWSPQFIIQGIKAHSSVSAH